MKGYHAFIALTPDKNLINTDLATPGVEDLYQFIRSFAVESGIGKYRRFDEDPDSPTHGFHIFDTGIVKLSTVVL
jgi:hypothetical protein